MEASRSPPVWPPIAGWRPAARRRPLRHQPGSPVRRQRRVLPLLDCSAAGDADAAPGDTGACRHLTASAVRRRLPLHVGARPPAHDGVRLRRREPAADRLFLLIVLIGEDEGLTPGQIGLLSAAVGVGTLVDSLASPWFRKVFASARSSCSSSGRGSPSGPSLSGRARGCWRAGRWWSASPRRWRTPWSSATDSR